jgi:uncharacterized protein YbaP (TraB family)
LLRIFEIPLKKFQKNKKKSFKKQKINKKILNKKIGQWKSDKQNGYGQETWENGSCYKGDYVESMKHGRGVFNWADGSKYVGEFFNNNIEGEGKPLFNSRRVHLARRPQVPRAVEGQPDARQGALHLAGREGVQGLL